MIRLLASTVLMICILTTCHGCQKKPIGIRDEKKQSPITFETPAGQKLALMSETAEAREFSQPIVITNTAEHSVEVRLTDLGCGCLRLQDTFEQPIAKGGQITIDACSAVRVTAFLKPPRTTGTHNRQLTFSIPGPNSTTQERKVPIIVEVIPDLEATPPILSFYQDNTAVPSAQQIALRMMSRKPELLEIDPKVITPVNVRLIRTERLPISQIKESLWSREWQLLFTLTKIDEQINESRVAITVGNGTNPHRLSLPVSLTSRPGDVRAYPGTLSLSNAARGAERSRKILLSSSDGTSFRIKEITGQPAKLKIEYDRETSRPSHLLTLTLLPDVEGAWDGRIVIAVDSSPVPAFLDISIVTDGTAR